MKKIIILLIFLNTSHLTAGEGNRELALKKIQLVAQGLKKNLKEKLKVSPIEAVEFCHVKAPTLTQNQNGNGIEIGRVSSKNRNSGNKVAPWMKAIVTSYEKGKTHSKFSVTDLENGREGLLMPIRTMPMCLTCHGQKIEPKLHQLIQTKYPNDKAVGYKAGEIRGYFWATYQK